MMKKAITNKLVPVNRTLLIIVILSVDCFPIECFMRQNYDAIHSFRTIRELVLHDCNNHVEKLFLINDNNFDGRHDDALALQSNIPRRSILTRIGQSTVALPILAGFSTLCGAADGTDKDSELQVFLTPSGLKYIDLVPGNGISPQYGNLCSIQYTAYVMLAKAVTNPNPVPEQYDTSSGFLIKHGNGRTIPGLDEGLHTMKVGGTRRILIPPKLAYIDDGLGPIPEYPWQRNKLNSLLDKMIAIGSGTLIFEVKLLSVIEDEADQGYYSDDSLSPEDFATLQSNLRIQGLQKRATAAAESLPASTEKQ